MSTACAWWPIMPDTKSTSAFVNGGRPLSAAAIAAGERPVGDVVDGRGRSWSLTRDGARGKQQTPTARRAQSGRRDHAGEMSFIPTPSVEARY